MLPGLARLHGYGFVVDVAKVRAANLGVQEASHFGAALPPPASLLRGTAKAALESCISGDGEAPLKLTIAAVACAGSGVVCRVPVQHMREDTLQDVPSLLKKDEWGYLFKNRVRAGELNLCNEGLQGPAAMLISYLIPSMGGLTSLDLSGNQLCGIWTDRHGDPHGTYTAEGITAIADALRVNCGLTVANLLGNHLDAESAMMLAEVAKQKGISLCGIRRDQTTANFSVDSVLEDMLATGWFRGELKPPDAILLASDLSQAVVTGGLTSIDLSRNQLCGIWIDGNGTQQGNYNAEGINAIADALRVNGALTVTNLLGNQLDAESAMMLAEVAQQKGISLCGIRRDQTTADFTSGEQYKSLGPPDAILLASDLSQAVVTGGLTSIDLSGNELCGIKTEFGELRGTYTAEGIAAIAEALRGNGVLTVANLLGNHLDLESAKMLAEVAQQKGISLCGIQRDQTTSKEQCKSLGPPDAILLASDLSQAVVTGGLTSIDLSRNQLCGIETIFGELRGTYTAEGISAIAEALRGNGALTVANLLDNHLDSESAKMLVQVAKQKGISLCGIRRDQTTADFSDQHILMPTDAVLLASDLSQAVVTGGLTSIDLSKNRLCGIWETERDGQQGTYTAEGITAIADALRVNGALTMLSLAKNRLGEEGTKAICEALEQNKTLKELDISHYGSNYGSNIGGSAGAKHVAKMLGVNSTLTSVDLRGNQLRDEGWGAIFAAICGNKDSEIMSMDAHYENIGLVGGKLIAEALRTTVTGALTEIWYVSPQT